MELGGRCIADSFCAHEMQCKTTCLATGSMSPNSNRTDLIFILHDLNGFPPIVYVESVSIPRNVFFSGRSGAVPSDHSLSVRLL